MLRLLPDDRARALLEPVDEVLQRALRLLPGGAAVAVTVGEVPGMFSLSGHGIVLSEGLLGPEIHHHGEPTLPVPPLDRWRRALACVLEGASMLELSRRVGALPNLADWRWVGAAVYAADAVAPEAGIALPDIARGLESGDLVATPRGGVLPYLAWRQSGTDPLQQAQYLLEGGIVSPQEWLKLGGWIYDAAGPADRLPVIVSSPDPVDVPAELSPWSWRPVVVPAHPRGGRIDAEGAGGVHQPWAAAGEVHRTLAGATDGICSLTPSSGGPVGQWEVASAEGFGQIMGARGISFHFFGSGEVELVLADAFVGPLAAVAMAEEVGTSGVSRGRWSVAGPQLLGFEGLRTEALTMHGRGRGRFALPAGGFGIGVWLQALEDGPWAWKETAGRLVLRGAMRGGHVEVRLRPADAP